MKKLILIFYVIISFKTLSVENLRFEVEVAGVREATAEELEHGHVHFHGFDDEE